MVKTAQLLRHTKLVTLAAPFTGRSYFFAGDLHVPDSLDVATT